MILLLNFLDSKLNTGSLNLLDRHTPENTTSMSSPDSEITVVVPELEKIGVRRPGSLNFSR